MLIEIVFVLVSVVIFYYVQKNLSYWKHIYAIPAPKSYPIIGHMLNLMHKPEVLFLEDRKRNADYYPIHKVWSFNIAVVMLLDPRDIELVLTNMKHIQKAELYDFLHNWLGSGLLTSTGSKWKTRRKILTPAFHFNILQGFLKIFNDETRILVDILAKRSKNEEYIDVVKPITEFTLISIGETAMGTKLGKETTINTQYKNAIYEVGTLLTHRLTRIWLHNPILYAMTHGKRKEDKLVNVLHKFSKNVIEHRRKILYDKKNMSYSSKKRLAMLDLLLSVKINGENLDDDGIREEVDTFMFEGHDTTSMAICYILMMLANFRDIQNEIYQEIKEVLDDNLEPTYMHLQELKIMERCIKECLRLYPSVPLIGRIAGEDILTSTGYTVPKGCGIHIYIFDLHRNPQLFPDPEKFNPNRFLPENTQNRHPFAYIPFSAGPRNCIGQKFAMLELKAVLCGILRSFILEPVDKPEDIQLLADLVLRPKGEIRVKFTPRC